MSFEEARRATQEASDAWETAAIYLATLEEDLGLARDALALVAADVRLRAPLLGKNAEDRDAELLVRLHDDAEWVHAKEAVRQKQADVETARAAVERARMRRQELLWGMRYEVGMGSGPIDEL